MQPDGTPLWFSRPTPDRTHDLTAPRGYGIVQACLTRQILVLADRAFWPGMIAVPAWALLVGITYAVEGMREHHGHR
ncbi:hypothetical protein FHS37_001773 [Streptomyces griseostramineus]|uniref:Uncharacterized protein n=1 Tax=Streptomyces griseomycini TaxID=66895 RepID=A0A7W7LY30_9ACTN|nr:hypothetical protein [Streptomyces griseomycini]GGR11665.1 hypothetical protein GCM10015536_16460 [Streptomyces griseomycini]